jgi:serine/threonine-protein kinase RsbW
MEKPKILPDGIIIPSSTDYLADVDSYVESRLRQAGIEESTVTDLAISVSELVNNAILHGNSSDHTKTVDIRVSFANSSVTITVTDQGRGFDPESLENPLDDDNLLREVGRGIFIVKNFVDDVRVKAVPSGGTRVEITKKY